MERDTTGTVWTRVSTAPWPPRDSAGEVVFNGKLWMFGGWESSYAPALRDVWSSPDGTHWTQVLSQAPWTHSDLPMTLSFGGKMWMMGGYDLGRLDGATASAEVWSSEDGANWTLEGTAGWTPRLAAGIVEFHGKMWIIGGAERYFDGGPETLKSDVWFSEDGVTWQQATADAGFAPRAFHNTEALNGRIYVFGGGDYVPGLVQYNDVWSSADGVTWRQETADAPWDPRIWAASEVYDGKIWLLGGYAEGGVNRNDIWTSTDGAHWNLYDAAGDWNGRHEMSSWVLNDRIWIGAGYDGSVLHSDVWSIQPGTADFLVGNYTPELLRGGGGNDAYLVEGPETAVERAEEGYDTVYTFGSNELARGSSIEVLTVYDRQSSNIVTLFGNELTQDIHGNNSTNFLASGGGADHLFGFGGDDAYLVTGQGEKVVEVAGAGFDTVYTLGSFVLTAGSSLEVLSVYNRSTTDAIDLTGNELDNLIYGNAGSNVLDGKGGSDTLFGMGGDDRFVFSIAGGVDTVVGFDAGDKLVLDHRVFAGLTQGNLAEHVTQANGGVYFDGALFAMVSVPLASGDFLVV